MDYIGSKEKLNKWIFSIILDTTRPNGLTFLDACAGSGSVSKYAAQYDFAKIISNDIMEFPSHIVRGAISLPNSKLERSINLINEMNKLNGIKGFFYHNYSEQAGRPYFSDDNAKKLDAYRIFIEEQVNHDPYIKSYLLYCLLEAMSSVSNTTGVQAAFLKKLKTRAQKPLIVLPKKSLYKYGLVKTFNKDILTLLTSKEYRDGYNEDILYIDPPYNERQYGPNYHLYETLVKYDNPKIYGKTGLRDWKNESKSDFCSKKTCMNFTKEIIEHTTAKSIYISYNSDGLLNITDFKENFGSKIEIFELDQKRYKSDASSTRNYNNSELKEYLIKIVK
jgi:adenine-specific DNA-methyltransferase